MKLMTLINSFRSTIGYLAGLGASFSLMN